MSISDELEKLLELKNKGVLSEVEFQKEKAKLIAKKQPQTKKPVTPPGQPKKSPKNGRVILGAVIGFLILVSIYNGINRKTSNSNQISQKETVEVKDEDLGSDARQLKRLGELMLEHPNAKSIVIEIAMEGGMELFAEDLSRVRLHYNIEKDTILRQTVTKDAKSRKKNEFFRMKKGRLESMYQAQQQCEEKAVAAIRKEAGEPQPFKEMTAREKCTHLNLPRPYQVFYNQCDPSCWW